jgi:hypothetical protein
MEWVAVQGSAWVPLGLPISPSLREHPPDALDAFPDGGVLGRKNEPTRQKQWNARDDWDYNANHSRCEQCESRCFPKHAHGDPLKQEIM